MLDQKEMNSVLKRKKEPRMVHKQKTNKQKTGIVDHK